MPPHFPVVLDDYWFRGVIYGVVVADLWAAAQGELGGDGLGTGDSWRSQFLEIARAEARGLGPPSGSGNRVFTQMAQRSAPGLLLLALPVLLLRANPYGHRVYPWQAWTASLDLPEEGRDLIDQAFQMVCGAMAGRPPSLCSPQGVLARIQGFLEASQGDFALALGLARQQGVDPLLLRGLGAVAMVQGGWVALPTALRHDSLESPVLPQRWDNLEEVGLNRLALALYDRWRGYRPGSFPQDGLSV